jgi:crotonobetainyl-CoA:carnitine CoA-transferase CaiB-like acyl-CoA transferase
VAVEQLRPSSADIDVTVPQPLSGCRVVDLSTWIAGGYCSKLLADGGAEVHKVEPAGGDPLRRWSASGAAIAPDADGALFNFLHASTLTADAPLDDLLASAHAVIWSRGSERTPRDLLDAHPHLTVTAITPFGLDGPWHDKPATEFTLQAWSGGIVGLARGWPDRPPVHVGGQIGEWLAGLFAAIGTMASRRRADPGGELVDVSMLEALALCLTYYPVTFNDQLGRPMRKRRFVPTPGVGVASDGLVGLGCGTGQQWLDFCVMVGHPEWMDDPSLFLDRTKLAPTIDAWLAEHTAEEVLDLASAFRIPNAPIANGENVPTFEHFRSRKTFVRNQRDGALNPRPPYRFTHTSAGDPPAARRSGPLPCSGLRVLDMTSFWAGPLTGHVLAMLGAEVIHLESTKRPDGVRLVGGVPQTEDRYWERGPIFTALNTNKKSLTLDLNDPKGIDLLRKFVATCDVVVENYTPRVLEQLGLDHESLRQIRPDLVMVRMPGFGLDGPWRDRSAFAFVIEDASGLTWLTGHPDLPPIEPYCVGDPNAGLHALFGLLLALEHRDLTGEGSLVEAAMVDAGLNVAAEQVIEHSAYGALLERAGNRGPMAAPQNLYQAAAPADGGRDDSWVAIAVADDEQWVGLRRSLGDPAWAADPALDTVDGRRREHDRIDAELGGWCRVRQADEIIEHLWAARVPVGKVVQPHDQPDLEQLRHRRFFEELDHPVAGRSRYSTLPMRFSRGPERLHARHAPLLGEHNEELLAELGLTPSEIHDLEAGGVVGRILT